MKKTLLVACMLAFAAGAHADFGRKMLKKDNVAAGKKAAKAATLSDSDMKKLSLQSVSAMDEQNPVVPDGDPLAQRFNAMVKGLGSEDGLTLNFKLYNVADVGVFPTKFEAFGLVFIECLACGTPVIGTAAGGPLEFVDDTVGALVPDFESDQVFSDALGETITRSLLEDWKTTKRAGALARASRYTLTVQCAAILAAVDELGNAAVSQPPGTPS